MPSDNHLKTTRLLREIHIPMRDGVKLAATAHLPLGDGPFPVALVRNAYNRVWPGGAGFVERGIAVMVQDVRGRYGSEGQFVPWESEPNDGWDTLEWLRQQPWCDGRIGMFG